jgi:hypothetical protein
MTNVMFRCPITHQPVVTGTSPEDHAALPSDSGTLYMFTCPACGLIHSWQKSEAWIETTA